MTLKKKLGIIIPVLSAVVCVALCGLLWWRMTRPQRIEVPVPGLSWGMTVAEVEEVLANAGIETSTGMTNGHQKKMTISLNEEEVNKLGFDSVGSLPFSFREHEPVVLEFDELGSIYRLTQVRILVEVPEGKGVTTMATEKVVVKALNGLYGPKHEMGCWLIIADELEGHPMDLSYSPHVLAWYHGVLGGEARLVYDGFRYVEALHNGTYPAK